MIPENEAKKEYLSRYKWSVKKLDEIESEITRCRLGTLPGAVTYDGMPHGSGDDSDLSDYAAKLDDLLMQYRRERDNLIDALREISQAIEAVEEPRCNILLRYRYIQLKRWRFIAERMGCSEDYVRGKLHGLALNEFKIPEKK